VTNTRVLSTGSEYCGFGFQDIPIAAGPVSNADRSSPMAVSASWYAWSPFIWTVASCPSMRSAAAGPDRIPHWLMMFSYALIFSMRVGGFPQTRARFRTSAMGYSERCSSVTGRFSSRKSRSGVLVSIPLSHTN